MRTNEKRTATYQPFEMSMGEARAGLPITQYKPHSQDASPPLLGQLLICSIVSSSKESELGSADFSLLTVMKHEMPFAQLQSRTKHHHKTKPASHFPSKVKATPNR